MYLAKLTSTATLLFVSIVGTCGLGNGFAVGYARLIKLYGNFVKVLQTPFQCAQVEFALAMHQYLAQFLALLHLPSGVLLPHAVEGSHHLFGVGFVGGLDGTGVFWIGVFNEVETVLAVLAIECVAGTHIFEFDCTTDVASLELLNLFARGARAHKYLCHALLRAAVGIGQVVALVHDAAHHLEVLHLANMGFDTCLEEIDRSGTGGVGLYLLATCIMHCGHFVYKRHYIAKEFHESAYAHIFRRTNAEYGEDAARNHALAYAFAHFVLGEMFCFEELLHQSLIIFGCGLNQGFVHGLCLVFLLGRYVLKLWFAAIGTPSEFFHQYHINQGVEVRPCLDWILHGHYLLAINALKVVNHGIVVAAVRVKLVNQEYDGLVQFFGVTEVVLRTHLWPKLAIDEQQCCIGYI